MAAGLAAPLPSLSAKCVMVETTTATVRSTKASGALVAPPVAQVMKYAAEADGVPARLPNLSVKCVMEKTTTATVKRMKVTSLKLVKPIAVEVEHSVWVARLFAMDLLLALKPATTRTTTATAKSMTMSHDPVVADAAKVHKLVLLETGVLANPTVTVLETPTTPTVVTAVVAIIPSQVGLAKRRLIPQFFPSMLFSSW